MHRHALHKGVGVNAYKRRFVWFTTGAMYVTYLVVSTYVVFVLFHSAT